MNRGKMISILVVVALVVGAVAAYALLPRKYTAGERMTQTVAFWNDKEAFLFVGSNTISKCSNVAQEKLAGTKYAYLGLLLGGCPSTYEQNFTAYHLLPPGALERPALPPQAATYGSWALNEGNLQLTSPATGFRDRNGFRWNGEKFVALAPEHRAPTAAEGSSTQLSPDDVAAEDDEADGGFLDKTRRKTFKDAGWHYKVLNGYEGKGGEVTLPMQLGEESFNLILRSFPIATKGLANFDLMAYGARSIELSGASLPEADRVLWSQHGWNEITKSKYESRAKMYGRPMRAPISILGWLGVLLFLMIWRFYSWGHLLFSFFTVKRKVLKGMATSFSFPPSTPAQFPMLDTAALNRYSQEMESMGFVKLLDFSLVSDTPNHPPSFCRLFAHTKYHCFGEVSQIFPKGKAPMAVKCSIQSCLENGWTLGFSDRKPRATSSLLRRRKALGVSMPEASLSELIQAFLKMREQICIDLGLSVVRDDTLEAYIAKVQRSATEMREAVQVKNFAMGLSEVYYRKFALLKTNPEYVWLGDYPKEAEQRKQGYPMPARAH